MSAAADAARLRQENARLDAELSEARAEVEKWRSIVLRVMGAFEEFRRIDGIDALLTTDAPALMIGGPE